LGSATRRLRPPNSNHSRDGTQAAWNQQNESARKTVECIVKIGELLLQADDYFQSHGDTMGLLAFEESLPFPKSVASKYRRIAMNATLVDRSFTQKLPPSVHSLYELSQVEPDELRKGLEMGVISAEFERSEIADYAVAHRSSSSEGAPGRPRKEKKILYDDLLLLKVDRNVSTADRVKLLEAISRLAVVYPEVQCVPAKKIAAERMKEIREQAAKGFEGLYKDMSPEARTLANLVDRAIEAARKNKNVVPANWEWLDRLHRELGMDVSGEVRASDIFKAARPKGIVSRFLPLKSHSQVAKVHILAMNYCDGKASALKELKKIADGVESKAADREEGQKIARAYLSAMPWLA
jgi:hypothetical protein